MTIDKCVAYSNFMGDAAYTAVEVLSVGVIVVLLAALLALVYDLILCAYRAIKRIWT